MPDLSTVAVLAALTLILFLPTMGIYRAWRAFRTNNSDARISFLSYLGAAVALGLGTKLAIAVFVLAVSKPLQWVTLRLSRNGVFPSGIAALVNDGVPLIALFVLISAVNAWSERKKDK